MTKMAAAMLALVSLGVAACGSDDDTDTTATTAVDTTTDDGAAAGDAAAFCDGLIEFNSAVNDVDLGDDSSADEVKAVGDQLAELWGPIAENAPDDLAAQTEELAGVLEQLQAGDGEAFNSDETFATYSEVVDGATDSCGYESVGVTAVDYGFEGVPATIPAGNVAFDFTNSSESEEHEMIVFSKADGVDLTFDEILALPEDEAETKIQFTAAAFAPPGESGASLATLEPGDYVMVCFIPVGGAEEGPPHFTQGMKQEFTVE
jgi:hypothetical protein